MNWYSVLKWRMCRAIIAQTGIPFGTGRLPPWTKSACRSMASKAFLMTSPRLLRLAVWHP